MKEVDLTLKSVNDLKPISQSLVKNLKKEFPISFLIEAVPPPIFLIKKLGRFAFKATHQELNPSTNQVRLLLARE